MAHGRMSFLDIGCLVPYVDRIYLLTEYEIINYSDYITL